MNWTRIFLAALGAFVAYFAVGFLVFTVRAMRTEYGRYPAVYRSQESMKGIMPFGMLAMFVAMFALAILYALTYRGSVGLLQRAHEGAHFGALIGIFAVGSFVVHNWVNLNIGGKLTLFQAIAYFAEWTVVGIVIGLIYRGRG
jgi:hypothetical protein